MTCIDNFDLAEDPFDSFRSVVVITCALHAQGPRFEPGRKHFLFALQIVGIRYLSVGCFSY